MPSATGSWTSRSVRSTWLGVILAGISVVCFVVAGVLADRGAGAKECVRRPGEKPARKELGKGKGTKKEPVLSDVDPEMAEIEALLRKRGIT